MRWPPLGIFFDQWIQIVKGGGVLTLDQAPGNTIGQSSQAGSSNQAGPSDQAGPSHQHATPSSTSRSPLPPSDDDYDQRFSDLDDEVINGLEY